MPTCCAKRARSFKSAWMRASMASILSRISPRSVAAGVMPVTARRGAAPSNEVVFLALRALAVLRLGITNSKVLALEVAHELDQPMHALKRHGVVEAGAHAA